MRASILCPKTSRAILFSLVALLVASAAAAQKPGAVQGRVTDLYGQPLSGVTVALKGTDVRAVTDAAGNYRLAPVRAGAVTVVVSRIGFESRRTRVTVWAGGTARFDFILLLVPVRFDDFEYPPARHREVHTPGARVDSLVPGTVDCGARTFSALLAGRFPGVEVRRSSGTVTAGSSVRLRGPSSALFRSDPLVVVDGVRVVSDPQSVWTWFVWQAPSLLDDLEAEDVERVEVLHGPAAAARYGPEGVNGVIEVTTRRARQRGTRVEAYALGGASVEATEYPANWGRPGPGGFGRCTLRMEAEGTCTPTGPSTSWNPLEQASPFRSGSRVEAGATLEHAGELGGVRLSGGAERELGVLRNDAREAARLRAALDLRPTPGVRIWLNAFHRRITSAQPLERWGGWVGNGLTGKAYDDSLRGYSLGYPDDTWRQGQSSRRTTAGGGARWRAFPWLELRTAGGVDAARQRARSEFTEYPSDPHTVRYDGINRRTRWNAEASAVAVAVPDPRLRLAAVAGVERVSERIDDEFHELSNEGNEYRDSVDTERRRTGVFLRPTLQWSGLLAGGTVRRDQVRGGGWRSSASVGVEWDVGWGSSLTPWLHALRLRGAYGSLERDRLRQFPILEDEPGVSGPPERVAEAELGADATLFGWLTVAATLYRQDAHDVRVPQSLVSQEPPYDVGRVENRGAELRVRMATPAGARLAAELELLGTWRQDRVLGLGDHRDGHPLGSYFGRVPRPVDADGNGILTCPFSGPCEVELGDTTYLGSPRPARTFVLAAGVGDPGGRVRLSARVYREEGVQLADFASSDRCRFARNCAALYDSRTPLDVQARIIGGLVVEDASFTRVREVALTLEAPAWLLKLVGAADADVTLAGRDLPALTGYSGLDPEGNAYGADPLARIDYFALPLPPSWTLRLDARF